MVAAGAIMLASSRVHSPCRCVCTPIPKLPEKRDVLLKSSTMVMVTPLPL
ncbi:hypothetical protein [Mesorhizobium sp.]|nr:hypothetical protein [Mesorhizobium sp.]